MIDKLKEKLENKSGGRILDVATGGGSFIARLIDCFADYTEIIGIDNADRAIQVATEAFEKENIQNAKFIKMDVEHLEFEDESFDTVVIANSLHHLINIEKSLNEMKRVLKLNGLFIISEMYSDNQSELEQIHVDFHHWWAEIDSRRGIIHNPTFKRQELIDIAKTLNLKDYVIDDQIWEIEDPKNEELLQEITERNDKYIELIKDHSDYIRLKEKSGKLKAKMMEIGWGAAKQVIIIGKKS